MTETYYYYRLTDANGVQCVDRLTSPRDTTSAESLACLLAVSYPEVIYFKVNNADPEFRVPR